MTILNYLHQCAVHRLMLRQFFAKLFFIIIITLQINASNLGETANTAVEEIVVKNIEEKEGILFSSDNNSSFCIFFFQDDWYLVWNCEKDLEKIEIPQNKELPLGIFKFERLKNIKTSKPCLIAKISIYAEMVPALKKTNDGWFLHLVPDFLTDNLLPNQLNFISQGQGKFKISSTGIVEPIKIEIENGIEFNIFATKHADRGLCKRESEYVNILDSVQGFCLIYLTDQIATNFNNNDLNFSVLTEPLINSVKFSDFDGYYKFFETFFSKNVPNILNLSKYLEDYIKQKKPKNVSATMMQKAWCEICICDGAKAQNTLDFLQTENPDIANFYYFKFLKACAFFMCVKYNEACEIFNTLPKKTEVVLWHNLTKALQQKNIVFEKSLTGILQEYPAELREHILGLIIPYLFETEQIELLKQIINEILPKQGHAKEIGDFYLSMEKFLRQDHEAGCKELEKVFKGFSKLPQEFKVEARFLTFMFKNSTAKREEILKELSIMRTEASGKDIEIKIAKKLFEYLEKDKNYSQIINILQDMALKFTKENTKNWIEQLLKKYLIKFFLESNQKTSQVKFVGLFNKYKETIENHPDFLAIALNVVENLEQLNLIKQAAELMQFILSKNTDKKKNYEYIIKTANLYIKENLYDETINLLQDTYNEGDFSEKAEFAKLLSKAFFAIGNHEKAVSLLKDFPNKENKRLIADIYIKKEDYEKVIDSLKDYLESLNTREDNNDRELGILQLSAAYRITQNYKELKKLKEHVGKFMETTKSKDAFEAFCRPPAEEIKTSSDLKQYINDSKALNEVIEKAKKAFS